MIKNPNFNWHTTSDDLVKFYKDKIDVSEKVIFLTGATEGIGKNTATAIADLNPKQLIIAARNKQKAADIVSHLKEKHNYEKVIVIDVDLASLDSVRTVPEQLKKNGVTEISIAIFNAGVYHMQPFTPTKDGFEWHFGINHLAHFLLWQFIEPLVIAASKKDEARLVVVSSHSHYRGRINWNNMPPTKENFGWMSWVAANSHYELSKLCNNLFANEVNRRMKEKGINVFANSLHPGTLMATGITHTNAAANFFVHNVLGWFTKSCAQGAATTIYCAFSTDLKGKGGRYFDNSNECRPSASANEENGKRLWSVTEEILAAKK